MKVIEKVEAIKQQEEQKAAELEVEENTSGMSR